MSFSRTRLVVPFLLAVCCLPTLPGALVAQGLSTEEANAFDFRFIGPANMSGRITALSVPPAHDGKTMFAAMASGGLWKTRNLGTTWEPVLDDERFSAVADVSAARSDPEVVWIGTGERNSLRSNSWGDGVYPSTDGGETWRQMLSVNDTTGFVDLEFQPGNPDVLLAAGWHRLRWGGGRMEGAGAGSGIWRSSDGGETRTRQIAVEEGWVERVPGRMR